MIVIETYSMKLSYSIALFFPPVLSNLETSKSKTTGETAKPRLMRASLSSLASILPLRSRSNFSKFAWKSTRNTKFIELIGSYRQKNLKTIKNSH